MTQTNGSCATLHPTRITLAVFAAALCVLASTSFRPVRAHAQTPAAKGDVHAGEAVFMQRCFQCHSVAEGEVRFGPSLYHELKKPKPKKTDAEVRLIIKNGKNKMPAWGAILSADDTNNLLAYIHTL